jgi:hypothetical protein
LLQPMYNLNKSQSLQFLEIANRDLNPQIELRRR